MQGQSFPLEPYERSRSLALAPQAPGFLLSTEWWLRYYDHPNHQRWQTATPSAAWAVNLSADGRYAVAAFADGTLRWYETTQGREVLALFVHPDLKRWIAWTPEGFYDAAPGAESLIGYHLNQGAEREGLFVEARQLRDRFYRPALIARRLTPEGDKLLAAAVKELGDVRDILAGHGQATDNGDYYFFPADIRYENEDALKRLGLGEALLNQLQESMPAKSLILLDTCGSGAAMKLASRASLDKSAISRLLRISQRAIIAAAPGPALEGIENHGVLTYTVLEALRKADYNDSKKVEVDEVGMYVRNRVPELTEAKFHHKQVPMLDLKNAAFPLARPTPPDRRAPARR